MNPAGVDQSCLVFICPQVNPPYYVKLVELVPHPETLPAVMDATYALMSEVGQAPVRLRKEIDGFALNRVQYAIIAESWRLVKVGMVEEQPPSLVDVDGFLLGGVFRLLRVEVHNCRTGLGHNGPGMKRMH